MIGATMSFLDSTIVNVALHSLASGLHASLTGVQWTVTGYLLALAAVIPVTGWAARRIGPARLYVAALAVFTVGSALCALSASLGMLVICRVLQGLGGGAILPVGTMIWTSQATKAQLARVMSLIGVPIVLAPMLGPTVGGLLIEALGWRSIFWLNLPIGAVGIVLARRLLPRVPGRRTGPLDRAGFLLASGGTVAVTWGLAQIADQGGFGAAALAALAAGVALLAGFAARSLRSRHPLLDLRLYTIPAFTAASVTTFSLGAAMFGGMILMPLYFQIVRHQDVLATGLLLIPSGVGAAVSNRLAAPLTDRIGAGATALVGGLAGAASTVPFVFLGADTSYYWLCAAMTIRGVGIGLTLVPAMTAAYRSLPSGRIADATPQLNVVQRIGAAIGTALFTVVLGRRLGHSVTVSSQAGAFGDTFGWVLAVTMVAIAPILLLLRAERRARRTAPPLTTYPGRTSVMPLTDAEMTYLNSQRLGRLATVDPHGAPQNNPVSFRWNPEFGTIDIGGRAMGASRKFRNLASNPRVAFVVDDIASIRPWKVRCVEIRGHAEALAGQEPAVPGFSAEIIRIHPDRVLSFGLDDATA
jgi:EmrB/QacA subfamily drug resistance transporter/PPOX class F420-dependent enzyme/OxyR family protein